MARALLLGASGLLGRALAAELRARSLEVIAPSRAELDLREPGRVAAYVARLVHENVDENVDGNVDGNVDQDLAPSAERATKPSGPLEWVINCAAFTDVDGAETTAAEAERVNADAVGELARACKDAGSVLLHFSTDYVFDGRAETPYLPNAERRPLSAYGRSKARGEELVEDSGAEFLIVRTSWLYAAWGKNFLRTMLTLLAERDEVQVVDDQWGRPSSALNVARSSVALLERGVRGIAHVADATPCSWYDFACRIQGATGGRARLVPCSSADQRRPARRPNYSALDLTATEAHLGPAEPLDTALAAVVSALRSPPGTPPSGGVPPANC